MKIHRLLLVLAFAAFPSAASAYSHSVTNGTLTKMRFWVNYSGCSNDTWILLPHEVRTFRSGLCCMSNVNAEDTTQAADQRVTKPAYYCKNTNWTVTGGPLPKIKRVKFPDGSGGGFAGGYSQVKITGP